MQSYETTGDLTTQLIEENQIWRLKLTGDLDADGSSSVWLPGIVQPILNRPGDSVIIDLAQVNVIDSIGLTFLLRIRKELATLDTQIILQNPSEYHMRLFEMMDFDRVFTIESGQTH